MKWYSNLSNEQIIGALVYFGAADAADAWRACDKAKAVYEFTEFVNAYVEDTHADFLDMDYVGGMKSVLKQMNGA